MHTDSLTGKDHENLTALLTHAFTDCQSGRVSVEVAVGTVAQLVGAIDRRNYDEARHYLQQGRKALYGGGA